MTVSVPLNFPDPEGLTVSEKTQDPPGLSIAPQLFVSVNRTPETAMLRRVIDVLPTLVRVVLAGVQWRPTHLMSSLSGDSTAWHLAGTLVNAVINIRPAAKPVSDCSR